MSTSYPGAIDTSNLTNPNTTDKTSSPSHAGLHANANDAIKAVQTKIGTGSSTPVVSTLLFGTGTGTSAWTQLTSSQLAASLSDETGTGRAVFATTPTLITPKIDTINENTLNNGVTVSGVNLKSGVVTGSGAGLTSSTVPGDALTGSSVNASKIKWSDTGTGAGIWWEELGRTTLAVAGDVITVSGLAARTYLQVRLIGQATGGTLDGRIIFNGDTGSNYSERFFSAATGNTTTSQAFINLDSSTVASGTIEYAVMDIINLSALPKLVNTVTTSVNTAGVTTAPAQLLSSGQWVNTTAQISSITFTNVGTGDFAIGSQAVVLGHN